MDRTAVERQLRELAVAAEGEPTPPGMGMSLSPKAAAMVQHMLETAGFAEEVRRLAEIRLPELVLYQNTAYARQYLEFVGIYSSSWPIRMSTRWPASC